MNNTKEGIRSIWAEVLKLKASEIADEDNFFLLGGDSLVMAQVMVRLQDKFQFAFILGELFALSSINKMAKYCDEKLNLQPYPASAAQCGLWYIEQVESIALYNTGVEFDFKGRLNVETLQNSLNAIIEKHNALRSSFHFPWKTGELLVKESAVDLLNITVQEVIAEELENFKESFYQQKFRLEEGDLFQVCLLQTGKNQHTLMLCLHHIITDAWSGGIFLQELEYYYKAFSQSKQISAQPLNSQYREYCEGQKIFLQNSEFKQQLLFWQNTLQGLDFNKSLLEKKTDTVRLTYNCAHISFELKTEQVDALKMLAVSEGVSLFMLNLTVFNTVLALNSDVKDISFVVPVANRKFAKWESIIGYFVNLIVLRNKVDLSQPFRERLKEIKRSTLAALQHQEIPFQELVKTLAVNDSESENPFSEIMFAYQNSPSFTPDFPELAVSINPQRNKRCHYGLKLEVIEETEGLNFIFEYATEVYEENTITKLAEDYQLVLSKL